MADVDAVLTTEVLRKFSPVGPKGHLARHLLDALDRPAGGPDAGGDSTCSTVRSSPTEASLTFSDRAHGWGDRPVKAHPT